jgi:hypothetical protein
MHCKYHPFMHVKDTAYVLGGLCWNFRMFHPIRNQIKDGVQGPGFLLYIPNKQMCLSYVHS